MAENGRRHAGEDKRALALTMAALGVVYGDIGTSPLYALKECFHGPHAIAVTAPNVLGILSLIFWSLVLIISIKYLALVLRADNNGEGGILSLMALVGRPQEKFARERRLVVLCGLFGAALLYGDGIITPAISVLSATEGLSLATPLFEPYVQVITVAILFGIFLLQSRGTARVGAIFGPVTLLWFAVLGLLGLGSIVQHPGILTAANPLHAVNFFAESRWQGFLVLGSVFLVVTGGEALYADMGHFGAQPIRRAWFAVVLPCLLLNYFGQGALLLDNPGAAENPFYFLAPRWALLPLIALATAATVIASQAVITGAFSLTWQAVQLGYLPRFHWRHTSEEEYGQIFIPRVNSLLLLCTVGLVLGFRTSSNLAAAYGVAVTTTMVITTVLFGIVALRRWSWHPALVFGVVAVFLVPELAFFGANIIKLPQGGWFPLLVGAAVLVAMLTWRRGREILRDRLADQATSFHALFEQIEAKPPVRIPGTAVYMTGNLDVVPPAMSRLLKHMGTLHERVVLLSVVIKDEPKVPQAPHIECEHLAPDLYRVTAYYGYVQQPNAPGAVRKCARLGLALDPDDVTYIIGRETLLPSHRPGMAIWRERLFAAMARNAGSATAFFSIPTDRVLEIGAQIEL
jgi:KUP system potassium uptake protein